MMGRTPCCSDFLLKPLKSSFQWPLGVVQVIPSHLQPRPLNSSFTFKSHFNWLVTLSPGVPKRSVMNLCCIMYKLRQLVWRSTGHQQPHAVGITMAVRKPLTYFTKSSWAHDWHLAKIIFAVNIIFIIQPGHKFAHAMTAQLSWHVQNCDLIQ